MSDLFQAEVPEEFIQRVFEVMALADWHIYQLLTKRAERMRDVVSRLPEKLRPRRHVWLGVSVENRRYGIPRVDLLRDTPAPVRFLSVEPLLEDVGRLELDGIRWVIVGGESGPGARPMREEWVENVRVQCRRERVPFFFKQWGGVQKSRNGRTLRGKTHDGMPRVQPRNPPSDGERRRRLAAAG